MATKARQRISSNPWSSAVASTEDAALLGLPARPTPLIRRHQELTDLQAQLRRPDVRLVTLSGPPGVGKTRLAIEVARRLAPEFQHSVGFVDLSLVTDPALVTYTIAHTLGLHEDLEDDARSVFTMLVDYLRDRELLLVLDNFEQVVDAATGVGELLGAATELKVLATSRVPLRLLWEYDFPVSPLSLPAAGARPTARALAQYPAVALFLARARAARPDFAMTEQNAPIVAEICARLDGLPLAIELAAIRIKTLPLAALADQLTRRLDVLTRGAQDLPARQQTLRSAIAWSYDLLTPGEQLVFRRVAAFIGGCTATAAGAVCPETADVVLDTLSVLVEKGLLRQDAEADTNLRFAMLESLREFGLEQLQTSGELDETQARHAGFFRLLAAQAAEELRGRNQAAWYARLDRDYDNLIAALNSFLKAGQDERALAMAADLHRFWWVRRIGEGQRWLAHALRRSTAPTVARARALNTAAMLLSHLDPAAAYADEALAISRQVGERAIMAEALYRLASARIEHVGFSSVQPLFEESIALFRELGNPSQLADALVRLGHLVSDVEDDKAVSVFEEALVLARECGDTLAAGYALYGLGWVSVNRGDYGRAAELFNQYRALLDELGGKPRLVGALRGLAGVARRLHDYDKAAALHREALALAEETGQQRFVSWEHAALAFVESLRHEYGEAAQHYRRALAMYRDSGQWSAVPHALLGVGHLALSTEQPALAARLWGAAEGASEALHASIVLDAEDRRHISAARAALGEDVFNEAWTAGRGLTPEEAVDEALRFEFPPGSPHAKPREKPRGSILTRREEEVAALVAQGLSNREIAQRLFITEGTAENHVQHIFNKLGFGSRTQVAVWAVEHGLKRADL